MADQSDVVSNQPIGLLLAAGRGRRMGGRKQFHLVPTEAGEKPLVVAAFDSICSVCRQMIVVVGHRADEVTSVLGDREYLIATADADAPMFRSVQVGLCAAQGMDASASVFLQLGDHPHVSPATLRLLLASAVEQPDKAVMPEYHRQGGHPVLVPATLICDLLTTECLDGLRTYWIEHPESCLRVAVEDETVVRDIDTTM